MPPRTDGGRSDDANPFYRSLADYMRRRRTTNGLLDEAGRLVLARKLERSIYEVLTLDYCLANLSDQQGIPEPAYKTDEEYRESLVMHTQFMLSEIEKAARRPDLLFFLDKSSRPVAWLLRTVWPPFCTDARASLPEIRFLSIDANRVFGRVDDARPRDDEIYSWQPSRQQLEDIRRVYQRDGRRVPHHPSAMKSAWVIDEVAVSGGTVVISKKLLESAFPNLSVEGKVWMPAGRVISGRRGAEASSPAQLAPWYSKHFSEGRGVGDARSNPFLSSRGQEDILSEALRTDIELLARDIGMGRQSVRPILRCFERDEETGEQDLSRPKYKVARMVRGRREVTLPAPLGSA